MTSLDFTVAIPTYNGEKRLSQVLERLRIQTDIEQINWEILIVDNNSTDSTAKLIEQYQQNWQHPFSLRYVFEAQQGLAFARNKAIAEAKGELVGFVDDDNLLASNWLISAYKFGREHKKAGAYASQIHGLFEVEPPEEIKPILFYLAINERGSQPLMYEPQKKGFPPGAGLVVRRQAWQDNVPEKLFFSGRIGSSMLGSEDAEALCYIHKAGWEIWYNPGMQMEHLISASRLERNYLISLMQSIGLPRYYFRMLLLPIWQRPLALVAYFINDLRKFVLYYIRYHNLLTSDIITACEMARLKATILSPFYLGNLRIKRFFQML
ncbi:hormogonium polysaccharide biosynthesis glycosyltransferase HpsE [Anabaena sp. CCY 0017]|uniref:hormogonium polysaccharide biosynthesis glycosyltransferase HpsE n=1 Tax=Anabaena sp. CCY 0017 TaxID=3103866 RepID=UPI0039C6B5ED